MRDCSVKAWLGGMLLAASCTAAGGEGPGPIDELEVTGERSLWQLRQSVVAAEDAVHELWNQLNDDPLFDIRCVRIARTGTNLRRRECAPRFVAEATSEHAREFFRQAFGSSGGGTVSAGSANAMISHFTPIFQQKMREAVEQNPALLEAVLRHGRLREDLQRRQAGVTDSD